MYVTDMGLITAKLESMGNVTTAKIIKDYINNHKISNYVEGVKYYNNENTEIINRKLYYYDSGGNRIEDDEAVNNKVPHNFHKLLVDQKVSYLFGKPIAISNDKDKALTDSVNDKFGDDFNDDIVLLGRNSSNKGIEWLHPFLNSTGEFDYVLIPAEEVIPIWDSAYQKELDAVIRYYPIWVNGKETIKAEYWTTQTVEYYIKTDTGEYVLDDTEEENPRSHFYKTTSDKTLGYGWEKVPFIPFRNNPEEYSDLKFYKQLIDQYDKNVSDLANNLEELQEIVFILKGYEGTDLAEFKQNLKKYKGIKVSEDGDVTSLRIEIPIEAKKEMLDRLEENIFMFGQGVNSKTDKFGNNPTGVALKFIYNLLDLKANIMERRFKKAIRQFLWFVIEGIKIEDGSNSTDNCYKDFQITVTKSSITNDAETVDICSKSAGVISDETIVAHHPYAENPQEELQRLEKQQQQSEDRNPYLDDNKVGGDNEE